MQQYLDVVWDDQDEEQAPSVVVTTQLFGVSSSLEFEPWDDDEEPAVAIALPVIQSRSDVLTETWGWRELRDYVVTKTTEINGPFPRNEVKEASIFKAFLTRWGPEKSQLIARLAFESHGGLWRGAPIRVERFCRSSDPYFAALIIQP